MTASPVRRRRRTIAAALSGVLVLGVAPAMGYAGWNVLKDSKAGTAAATVDVIAFPSTPTAMIAIHDESNVVTALAVVVLAPKTGKGGTLVSVPTNATRAQVSGDAQIPIAQSLISGGADGLGGEDGLVSDVESLMRVTINYRFVLDAATATSLFGSLTSLTAAFPNDVVTSTADGAQETLFVAGSTELTPAQAVSVLVARAADQTEAARLPNVRAVWNGYAAAVANGVGPDAVTAPAPIDNDSGDYLAHLLAGPIQVFNDLATTPVVGKDNPDKIDVGVVDIPSVVLLMAGLAPSAMIAPLPTQSFRIENGLTQADIDAAGLVGVTPADVTRDLVARLLFLQGNVISVSPVVYTLEPKSVPDKTVVFSDDGLRSTDLEAFTKALGELEFRDLPFSFPLVDIVIVVGRTYLDDMARIQSENASSDTVDTAGDSSVSTDESGSDFTNSADVSTPAEESDGPIETTES